MTPIDAIGYAIAALLAMPVVLFVFVIAGSILVLFGAFAFAAMVGAQEWISTKWRQWKARKQ